MNIAQCLILLTWPFSRSLYRRLISKVSYLYLAGLTINCCFSALFYKMILYQECLLVCNACLFPEKNAFFLEKGNCQEVYMIFFQF